MALPSIGGDSLNINVLDMLPFRAEADGLSSQMTITHNRGRMMGEAHLISPQGEVSYLHVHNIDEDNTVVSSSITMLGTIVIT
jgi:hypothetical protein